MRIQSRNAFLDEGIDILLDIAVPAQAHTRS